MMLISLIRNSLVLVEPTIHSNAIKARNTVIRFIERKGNESNMSKPLQAYVGKTLELRVDHGNPTSLIKQQV